MTDSFQSFTTSADPRAHPPRLARLREELARRGLDGFIVPRADTYQGEYVAASDARLGWLTGFTGSAGFAIVTPDTAGVFVDGRYRLQVRKQVDLAHFTPVNWPETKPADWLRKAMPEGGRIGFDPWLHTRKEIEDIEAGLAGSGIGLIAVENAVDAIWADRPAPPVGAARIHPEALAGESAALRRSRIADALRDAGQAAAVLTLPDSISWLLNIRGSDIAHNPVVQAFAVIDDRARVSLFTDPAKFDASLMAHLGNDVSVIHPQGFAAALGDLAGPVRVDPATAPVAVFRLLQEGGADVVAAPDPVILPKACKTGAEVAGMRIAHQRDAVAMVETLAWLAATDPATLTEIDVVKRLEAARRAQGALDISFDTICGSGPNGAIMHYRVDELSNRRLNEGELMVLDSGGQYTEGTTDITRTIPMGAPDPAAQAPYTRVLQGMIAISRLKFPRGVAGRDIDAVARAALWMAGQDFDHGTGHGVGAALCVHEGPVRISRVSEIPLQVGMILSNEPGYYREGAFGIRIENLIVVTPAVSPDGRDMLQFETLTHVPIDTGMLLPAIMSTAEIDWLNEYHAQTRDLLAPLVSPEAKAWLERATQPIAQACSSAAVSESA